MKRKISWNIYIGAFIISIIIFGVGVYLGAKLNISLMGNLGEEFESLNIRMHSYEILFLLDNSTMACELYKENINYFDTETYNLGATLEYMEQHQGVEDRELKKQYFELEARDYLISKKIIQQCDIDQSIILYFYSNTYCDYCKEQGFELTKVKEEININNQTNVRTYSFDGDYDDSAVVRALKKEFDIDKYPTLIINGEKYEGFRRSSEIKKYLS